MQRDKNYEEQFFDTIRQYVLVDARKLKLRHPRMEIDDLTQTGIIAAWVARKTWRKDGGASQMTYVMRASRYAMYHEVKRSAKRPSDVVLDESEIHKMFKSNFTDQVDFQVELQIMCEGILGRLAGRQKDVAQLLIEGYPAAKIALMLGITRGRVSQIIHAIREITQVLLVDEQGSLETFR